MTSWAKILVVENLTSEEVQVLREAMFNVYFNAFSKRLTEGVSAWALMEAATNKANGQLTVQTLDPVEVNVLNHATRGQGAELSIAPDRSSVSFLDGKSAIAAINSIANHPDMYRMDVPSLNNLLHKVFSSIGRSLGMSKPPQAKEQQMDLGGQPEQVPPNLSYGGSRCVAELR
jgi:hypothetical protein